MTQVDLVALVADCPQEDLARLIGALESAGVLAWARFLQPPENTRSRGSSEEAERNLSAGEAAGRLGMSRDWLYKNASRLPFSVRIGRRVLFSARGLERWLKARTSG